MKGYRVYFEFYGRQMVTEVEARNEHEAKERVKERITFLKVKEVAVEVEPDPLVSIPIPHVRDCASGLNEREVTERSGSYRAGKTIMDFIYGFRKF